MKHPRVFLICLFLTAAMLGWAGRVTRLTVIGFSEDGRYIAYEILGPYDQSGRAFSIIQIVDVVNNDFAAEDIVTRTDDKVFPPEEELQAANRIQAQPLLDQYGIVDGNLGLVAYRLEQIVPWERRMQLNKQTELRLIDAEGITHPYTIQLDQRVVETDQCDYLKDWDLKPRIFTLTVRGHEWSRVLQHDRVLYRSRRCPHAYAVAAVYIYGNQIAVFLNAYSLGFEGDDVNKLIVTGTLDRPFVDVASTAPTEPPSPWQPDQRPTAPLSADPAGEISLAAPDGWGIIVEMRVGDAHPVTIAGFFDAAVHQERFQGGVLVPGALDLPGSLPDVERFSIRALLMKPDGGEIYRELSGRIRNFTRLILNVDQAGELQLFEIVG
jgi:predicted secreted protein